MKSNNYSGFHKLSVSQRAAEVAEFANLTEDELRLITEPGALHNDVADKVIENVIGTYQFPMGVAMNFIINGKEVLVPMVVEEASSSPRHLTPQRWLVQAAALRRVIREIS